MPVNLYKDKFRSSEREHGQEGGSAQPTGKSKEVKRGWEVIKKAIFTPIGTKEYPLERRRRSRRNSKPRKPGEMADKETENAPFPPTARHVPAKSEFASPSQSELTYPELAQTYQHTYMVPHRAGYPTPAYQDPTIYHDQDPTIPVPAYHVHDPPVHVPNLHPRPGHTSYKTGGKYV
jgi:hypothetical protein